MKAPTGRLVAGLVFALAVIASYAAYTLRSVHRMRELQTAVVDRNRLASLQLIRIQGDLNALGLALRDMIDGSEDYPLTAWRAPLQRIRQNLEDAVSREADLSPDRLDVSPATYLRASVADFWRAADSVFSAAGAGDAARASRLVRDTLQPRQEALSSLTARLLVQNHDRESQASAEVRAFYTGIERNAYVLLAASLLVVVISGAALIRFNRRLFARLTTLASERQELARQLIATQESTFRSISRDLHDEFGQILTALGAMLRRADRLAPDAEFRRQSQEIAGIVQDTLEKIRALSQSLQPVILEEQGLREAITWHLATFERQTGIAVDSSIPAEPLPIAPEAAIHVFRIIQEALNNAARHAQTDRVTVNIRVQDGRLVVEVADCGKGIAERAGGGLGLAGMRERAELIGATFAVRRGELNGTQVILEIPIGEAALV